MLFSGFSSPLSCNLNGSVVYIQCCGLCRSARNISQIRYQPVHSQLSWKASLGRKLRESRSVNSIYRSVISRVLVVDNHVEFFDCGNTDCKWNLADSSVLHFEENVRFCCTWTEAEEYHIYSMWLLPNSIKNCDNHISVVSHETWNICMCRKVQVVITYWVMQYIWGFWAHVQSFWQLLWVRCLAPIQPSISNHLKAATSFLL